MLANKPYQYCRQKHCGRMGALKVMRLRLYLVAISAKAWAYPKSHMSAPKKAVGAGGNCSLSKGVSCRPQVLKTPKYHYLFGLSCINQDGIFGTSGCFSRCCRPEFGTVSAIACKVSKNTWHHGRMTTPVYFFAKAEKTHALDRGSPLA